MMLTVNLSPQVAEYADDEPGAQLPRIPLSTRDHQSHGVALSPLRAQLPGWALVHDSSLTCGRPNPEATHRLRRYDSGRPSSVI